MQSTGAIQSSINGHLTLTAVPVSSGRYSTLPKNAIVFHLLDQSLKIICVFYGTIRRSDFFLRNAYISCAVCSVVSLKLTIPYCNRDFCVPDILFGLFFTDVVGTLFVDVCIIKRETVNINGCRLEVDNSGLWQFCNSTKFFYYYSIFRIVCIAFFYRIRALFCALISSFRAA